MLNHRHRVPCPVLAIRADIPPLFLKNQRMLNHRHPVPCPVLAIRADIPALFLKNKKFLRFSITSNFVAHT